MTTMVGDLHTGAHATTTIVRINRIIITIRYPTIAQCLCTLRS